MKRKGYINYMIQSEFTLNYIKIKDEKAKIDLIIYK